MYCRKSERNSCKARPITAQEAWEEGGGGGGVGGGRIHDNTRSISSSTRKQEVLPRPQDGEIRTTEANEGGGGGYFSMPGMMARSGGGGGRRRRSEVASHLDTVRSAKCFCWLSACLDNRQIKVIFFFFGFLPTSSCAPTVSCCYFIHLPWKQR